MQSTTSTEANAGQPAKKIGFAAMDPERQREIASIGGRAAHKSGNAHRFNSEEGRAAASKRRTMEKGAA